MSTALSPSVPTAFPHVTSMDVVKFEPLDALDIVAPPGLEDVHMLSSGPNSSGLWLDALDGKDTCRVGTEETLDALSHETDSTEVGSEEESSALGTRERHFARFEAWADSYSHAPRRPWHLGNDLWMTTQADGGATMPWQEPGASTADARAKLRQQGGQILAAMEAQPGWKRALRKEDEKGRKAKQVARQAARQAAMAQAAPAPDSLPLNLRFSRFSC